jgi:hypothetical protein
MHETFFYNRFIIRLYMFRALCAHHQEVKIVLYSIWYHHTETREWSKITKIQFYKYEHMVVKFMYEVFGFDYCILLTINMLCHVDVTFIQLLNLLKRCLSSVRAVCASAVTTSDSVALTVQVDSKLKLCGRKSLLCISLDRLRAATES